MPVLRAVFQFVRLALCFHCQDNTLDYSPRAPTEHSLLHRRRDLLRYNSIISEDLMTPKFDTILEYQLRGTKHLDIIVLYTDGSVLSDYDSTYNVNQLEDYDSDIPPPLEDASDTDSVLF
ncbi:hypothetical protein B0H13DRAFT_1979114 [Mycena leptocephala]|nr:hypothetical protein B0H13DRAFT_1979114 [Mycena leptocephala]